MRISKRRGNLGSENENYHLNQILNMDESACYLDTKLISSKRVLASTSGNDRTRMLVAFTAASNGTKLPVFGINTRKKEIFELNELSNIVIEYKTKSTFDEDMIITYLRRIILPYLLKSSFSKILLLIDSATCHLTKNVKDFCYENNIFLCFIPPRLTNLLQPADVVWFCLIKKKY